MHFSFFPVVMLLHGASTALGQGTVVTVPVGGAPIIDGTIDESEWRTPFSSRCGVGKGST